MQPKVAIIYYSSTGTTYQLARAIEEGAREAGAEVKLLKVKKPRRKGQSIPTKNGQSTSKRPKMWRKRSLQIWNGLML